MPRTRSQAQNALVHDTEPDFLQFRRLPAAIQNLIWEFALPGPRVHHIEYIEYVPALVNPGGRYLQIECLPFPAMFRVCRQSRHVASTQMTKFPLNTALNLDGQGVIPYGFCDPDDTLFIEKAVQSQTRWKLGNNPFATLAYGLQANGNMHAPPTEFPTYRDLFAGFTPSGRIALVKIQEMEGFDYHQTCKRVLLAGNHQDVPGIVFEDDYHASLFERDLMAWKCDQALKAKKKGETMPEIDPVELPMTCDCDGVKEQMEEEGRELNKTIMEEWLNQNN
ncbi:hypothetical protein FBEOM_12817 [Fusarium beomiforme]|uniref:2EXR domain-containing protein n=1 Tax=Fusarium beomiforme TaxID=44412 RepID=A0A9P5A6Y4_9HYPO|nr:hypothetical protein FBEOM_12817 [Fusarium beomiforme]